MIRLYGKNRRRVRKGDLSYWTDIGRWCARRRIITGREPLMINVTSNSRDRLFRDLSPMRLGPVACYRENGRTVSAVSVEVAWQYSKVYSEILEGDELISVRDRYIARSLNSAPVPSREWFRWRDAAFTNPGFAPSHRCFEANKGLIRRAFPKGSKVAFWYWAGKVIEDPFRARQEIYVKLYTRLVRKTRGFHLLQRLARENRDLKLFDFDGYDWIELGMSPLECMRDAHSFGHGMLLSFLLYHIDPRRLRAAEKWDRVFSNGH